MESILIFAGGPPPPIELATELPETDLVVAADSGYETAVALGFRVDVVVGDLDSIITDPLPDHVIVERHPRDKDKTDLDLALELALREEPGRVVIASGTGGRHDHELATAELICSDRWRSIDELDWISARSRSHVVRRRRLLHGDIGALVSLLAVGGYADGITTQGLKWELTGGTLEPGSTHGISNVMRTPVIDVTVSNGCLLVVFPL